MSPLCLFCLCILVSLNTCFYARHSHTMLCYNQPWNAAETARRYSLSKCTGCEFYIHGGVLAFHLQRCTGTARSINLLSPADSLHRSSNERGGHPLDLSAELSLSSGFSGNDEPPGELQNGIVPLNREEGDDSLGGQDDGMFQFFWSDSPAASNMDSSTAYHHSLLGSVYLAGWSQWTELDDDIDPELYVPFKVFKVETEENGREIALLYAMTTYDSAALAFEWNGWGIYDPKIYWEFPGKKHAFGYRTSITRIPVTELFKFPKLGEDTARDINLESCCICGCQITSKSGEVRCRGRSTFSGDVFRCFQGLACKSCAKDPETWLRTATGVDSATIIAKKIFLCGKCRERATAPEDVYGPNDQVHPTIHEDSISVFNRPVSLFPDGYDAVEKSKELLSKRTINFAEARRTCNTGSAGVAVQEQLLALTRRLNLSVEGTRDMLVTLNDLDTNGFIQLNNNVPLKASTLERNGRSRLPNREDFDAVSLTYDTSKLLQNETSATAAFSNIHEAVQSLFDDLSFPPHAWRLEGATGYTRDADYVLETTNGERLKVTGPESHQASRWKELEKNAQEGYCILYLINHSDKADSSSGKLHPFRFELANLEKRYRQKGRGSRALSLLAIPKMRREEDLTEQQMTVKVQLRSTNFAQALIDAEKGSRPPGVNFTFRGTEIKCLYVVLNQIGDYEEQVGLATCLSGRCVICPAIEISDAQNKNDGLEITDENTWLRYLSGDSNLWGSSLSYREPDWDQMKSWRTAGEIHGLKTRVQEAARSSGYRTDTVNQLGMLSGLFPERCGGLSGALGVDELHTVRSGACKVMLFLSWDMIIRYFEIEPGFSSQEDVMHVLGEYSSSVPNHYDGSRHMIKIDGGPLAMPRDTMGAETWEAGCLQMPYFLLGNTHMINDDDTRGRLLEVFDNFTEAWGIIRASDEVYMTEGDYRNLDGILKKTTEGWIWWHGVLKSPFPDGPRPYSGDDRQVGNLTGMGFNRIKCHLVSHITQTLEKNGGISSTSTRAGEQSMKILKTADQGTRNDHSKEHNLHVLRTLLRAEAAKAMEPEAVSANETEGDQYRLQLTFDLDGTGLGKWNQILHALKSGINGPQFPETFINEIPSTIRQELTRFEFPGGSAAIPITIGKEVLGTFGKRYSIVKSSGCVQLDETPVRFAQIVAFVKQSKSKEIYAAVCAFTNPRAHPEHSRLLVASRSNDIALVPVEKIMGTLPVTPYFAELGKLNHRSFVYSKFIIDTRLIWRLGGKLRMDTKADKIRRLCPGSDPQNDRERCPGAAPMPAVGSLAVCPHCRVQFQW